MIPDKILYTDGHDVTVTDSEIQIKKNSYKLNGIIKHGLMAMYPNRLPSMLLLLLGVVLLGCGLGKVIPSTFIQDIQFNGTYITANTLALITGSVLILTATLVLGMLKKRYAVRIATAEGEKNVIISRRKEYVAQIVDALNKAFTSAKGFTTYSTNRK